MTKKDNNDTILKQASKEPNYPKDTKFLAQYIMLSNRYDLIIGEDLLLKLENFIKLLENLKEKELFTHYYENLEESLNKLAKFTGIAEKTLFLDLHGTLRLPIITDDNYIQSLNFEDILKKLAIYKDNIQKRELLKKYYNQYFNKL